MKTCLPVLFTTLLDFVSIARGDSYRTLVGYQDSIHVPAGQTAFVVNASSHVVLEVKKASQFPIQFRFAELKGHGHCGFPSKIQRNVLPHPSAQSPVAIAGPAQLTLRTTGMLTLTLPEGRRRSVSSSTSPVRRYAVNW